MIGHEGGVYRPNFIIPHLKSGRVCAGMSVRHPDLPNKKWQGLRQNHWQGLPRNRWQGLDRNSGRVYVGILSEAVGQQLRYLRRNLSSIDKLIRTYELTSLIARVHQNLDTIRKVYEQQLEMYRKRNLSIVDWIVNIHQPYVRPILRVKKKAKFDFGSKINVSLINGYTFIDYFSWYAFN